MPRILFARTTWPETASRSAESRACRGEVNALTGSAQNPAPALSQYGAMAICGSSMLRVYCDRMTDPMQVGVESPICGQQAALITDADSRAMILRSFVTDQVGQYLPHVTYDQRKMSLPRKEVGRDIGQQ